MAASEKVHVISTKYFICINWGHYVIYLHNIKFVQLILWPEGAYTDDTYATKPESRSHISIHFMNHDYICYDTNRLSLEFSNSPDNKAVRLPLKFKSILTIPQMCNQLGQTVKAA